MTEIAPLNKIAITGGTGFIGGRLMNALSRQGFAVKALTRREDAPDTPGVTWVKGDMENAAALRDLVQGCEAVIHCAGAVKAPTAAAFHAANADAVARLVEIASSVEGKTPFLIHLSSLAAREPHLSTYAASKARGEEALNAARVPWVALRPPAVYGPGDLEILKLFKSLKFGLGFVPGRGDGRLSIIHVEDLAAAVITLLATRPASAIGKIFELGDERPEGYTLPEIYDIAGGILGRRARLVRTPSGLLTAAAQINRAMAHVTGGIPMLTPEKVAELTHPDWVARGDRLEDFIPWTPQIGLEAGLRQTFEWYRTEGYL